MRDAAGFAGAIAVLGWGVATALAIATIAGAVVGIARIATTVNRDGKGRRA